MLPDEIKVSFTFSPKFLLVSPVAALLVIGMFFLPWGAENAPAWGQAIGSVGAIVAAFLIANHQHVAAERNKRTQEHERNLGFASRLAFFALELDQIMSNVVLSDHQPGVADVDAKAADFFEVMLKRLNQNFDDDPDLDRAGFCYRLRVLLAGCIFTLRATSGLAREQRDLLVAQYKTTSQEILNECAVHAKAVNKAA